MLLTQLLFQLRHCCSGECYRIFCWHRLPRRNLLHFGCLFLCSIYCRVTLPVTILRLCQLRLPDFSQQASFRQAGRYSLAHDWCLCRCHARTGCRRIFCHVSELRLLPLRILRHRVCLRIDAERSRNGHAPPSFHSGTMGPLFVRRHLHHIHSRCLFFQSFDNRVHLFLRTLFRLALFAGLRRYQDVRSKANDN